jgi:hypothetical protein
MHAAWVAFATTGNPGWLRYDLNRRATILFFAATNSVRSDVRKLAAVEATQAGEVVFTLLGELIFLAVPLPSILSFGGMVLVIAGMLLHSLVSHKKVRSLSRQTAA